MSEQPISGTEGGKASVAVAAIISGLAGFVVQLLAARHLSKADNSAFLVYWGALFGLFGVLAGTQNESTRAVRAQLSSVDSSGRHPRALGMGLLAGLGLAGLTGLTAPVWAPHILVGEEYITVIALICAAVLAFSGHVSVTGALAGLGRWGSYSFLVAVEALVRLIATVIVLITVGTRFGFEVAAGCSTLTWLMLSAVSPRTRAAWAARVDRPAKSYVVSLGQTMFAATATAALITGFPVLISATTSRAVVETAAPLMLALSLTRATLLLPLSAFQGMAIAHVVQHPNKAGSFLTRLGVAVVGLGVLGAGAAWLVGPWLMRLINPSYDINGGVLAALMLDAAAMTLLVLASSIDLALSQHRDYLIGWWVALVMSVLVLLLPWGLEERVIVSLIAGPAVGGAVHLWSVLTSLRTAVKQS